MKKLAISSSLLCATIFTHPLAVASHKRVDGTSVWDGIVPYVGADAQWRHMNFKKGFGENLVKRNYPQGNLYAGVKFNEYVGIEGGYESTTSKSRTVTIPGSADWFGVTVDRNNPTLNNQFRTKTKIQGPHLNLVGFLPISEEYCLQLIGSIGMAQLKMRAKHTALLFDNLPVEPPLTREFTKKKWIPRVNAGVQHMMTSQFGLRAMVGWENTARLKNIISPATEDLTIDLTAALKNSINLGLGLFYNFK